MATWIVHLRIAENLLNKGYNFDTTPFTVGNIGPDSGVPNEDWSNFNPPKKITHWVGNDNKIKAHDFWDKYLKDGNLKEDNDKYSFLMGYYVHLLTDIEWSEFHQQKKQDPLYKQRLDENPKFIWTIKKDWYGLDYLFLSKHKESIFYTVFKNVKEVPDYLDYFPSDAFERQVKYITEFYLGENNETKGNFIYLNEEEMDNFVYNTTKKIDDKLKILGVDLNQ